MSLVRGGVTVQFAGLLESDQNPGNSNDPLQGVGFGISEFGVLGLGMNLTRYFPRKMQHNTSKM